jgi:hypothetical protein
MIARTRATSTLRAAAASARRARLIAGSRLTGADADGTMRYVNVAFERTIGRRRPGVPWQYTRILVSGEQPDEYHRGIAAFNDAPTARVTSTPRATTTSG